jgi:hypothetical protein
MHYLYLFSEDDVSEDGKERKHSGHGRLPVDDQKGDMIDLEAVG